MTLVSNAVERIENNNVIQLKVINGSIQKKNEVSYNKDGSVCKISNHKKRGVSSEVYGFTTEEELSNIMSTLNNEIKSCVNPTPEKIARRNKLLFLIGMNIGLRESDLCTLKWSFFIDRINADGTIVFNNSYKIMPKKTARTGKFVTLYFNETVRNAIEDYLSYYPVENLDDYIFTSRKGGALASKSLGDIVKTTALKAGITDKNICGHSLRKTWGYWAWHNADEKDKALVVLQRCFRHSSTLVTMQYIGIAESDIEEMYDFTNVGLGLM